MYIKIVLHSFIIIKLFVKLVVYYFNELLYFRILYLAALEFTLGVESSTNPAWLEPCDITFGAPSVEQKLTWKNILQQRIKSSKYQHEHLDVDNVV